MINILDSNYSSINSTLEKYNKQLESILINENALDQYCSDDIKKVEEEQEKAKDSLSQKIARTKALFDIARTHTSKHVEAAGPIEYDHGVLSRLAVQINSGIKDDPFAGKLYTEASGQLMTLKSQLEEIDRRAEALKQSVRNNYYDKKTSFVNNRESIKTEVASFLKSTEVMGFAKCISYIKELYRDGTAKAGNTAGSSVSIAIGMTKRTLNVCPGCEAEYISALGDSVDIGSGMIDIPLFIDVNTGAVVVVKYVNENEESVLRGIQKLIINYGRIFRDRHAKVTFIDPIRYNSGSLGLLSELCGGEGALIENVPTSKEDVRKTINNLLRSLSNRENADTDRNENDGNRLIIIHDFPQGYDSEVVGQIQQLCVNAKHYGVNVILTSNFSNNRFISSDVLNYIESFAVVINNKSYFDKASGTSFPFSWFEHSGVLPADITEKYIDARPVVNKSNVYEERVGLKPPAAYHKGYRFIENVPYGIDQNGVIQKLSFEGSNYATFICGASRSGKSTLLHTLITGIIKNMHPDDVEIWLIDFKMTEFSRYTNHLPPHVRYIILDESPELVYDIINRLTEILQKRQNIFKGKWLKLDDVPPEKYMPAIFVVIDEFSVMSQIIADSVLNSKDNYSIKLQALLAKGAAMGLHFVFASQGFTSGTRGLNDFSKKQIQQRIAMKTEYNEIRETLDLKSSSDEDKLMMEQLTVHHTLTRNTVDEKGNHLRQSKVLYISDYDKQEEMIESIKKSVTPAAKYDVQNPDVYINKRPMIIDGNAYTPYKEKEADIESYIESHNDILSDGETNYLFVGEPRRMVPLYPLEIEKGFCQNVLIVTSNNEKLPATSILLSIEKSLQIQNTPVNLWTSKKSNIYKQYIVECQGKPDNIAKGLAEVCKRIKELRNKINNRIESNQFFVLLGFESLIMDMAFQETDGSSHQDSRTNSNFLSKISIEKRRPGEMDLLSKLKAAENGDFNAGTDMSFDMDLSAAETSGQADADVFEDSDIYDAREDLKYILTHGPNLGYHFIMVFNSVGDMKQSKTDISLFKHKILFRTARQEAVEVVGSSGSNVISELDDHTFRYTDGIESVSFRPYLHKGLSWDGWSVSEYGEVDEFGEEEYLL